MPVCMGDDTTGSFRRTLSFWGWYVFWVWGPFDVLASWKSSPGLRPVPCSLFRVPGWTRVWCCGRLKHLIRLPVFVFGFPSCLVGSLQAGLHPRPQEVDVFLAMDEHGAGVRGRTASRPPAWTSTSVSPDPPRTGSPGKTQIDVLGPCSHHPSGGPFHQVPYLCNPVETDGSVVHVSKDGRLLKAL